MSSKDYSVDFRPKLERSHHLLITEALKELNGDLLESAGAYFGGGTAIALIRNEYRESVDLDFLTSDFAGFRRLRELARERGLQSFLKHPGQSELTLQVVRQDEYAIRCVATIMHQRIKLEIIQEGRIAFDQEITRHRLFGVTRLSREELIAQKVMANHDRWQDAATLSRDILDLAMLSPSSQELLAAHASTEQALKSGGPLAITSAIDILLNQPESLVRSMILMRFSSPPAFVTGKLQRLRNLNLRYS